MITIWPHRPGTWVVFDDSQPVMACPSLEAAKQYAADYADSGWYWPCFDDFRRRPFDWSCDGEQTGA